MLLPDQWVKLHADYLYKFALSMLQNKEEAKDLIQETFLSAFKNRNNFKGKSTERTWLTSILKNKILDFYRKRAKTNMAEPGTGNDDYFNDTGMLKGFWRKEKAPASWPMEEESESEGIEGMESILEKCMDNLPPTLSGCFHMKYVREISFEEICKELGISESNFWTRVHRAKLQLRNCIEVNWKNK